MTARSFAVRCGATLNPAIVIDVRDFDFGGRGDVPVVADEEPRDTVESQLELRFVDVSVVSVRSLTARATDPEACCLGLSMHPIPVLHGVANGSAVDDEAR